jgi:hypothetical protein
MREDQIAGTDAHTAQVMIYHPQLFELREFSIMSIKLRNC